ncbi:MAG TPA: PAS domain S-box protein [Candidatus Avacidaminococcus intestinavium]|uniref:PAS domain S-box protein n=1 Tax=Candidatus Avacidaminococcus intestinavium TaxID=2840684 RepID=A0A9D1MPB2_9FIRM|nr:PAS domain S-box protein [Candidatus Avacidaminococcus intestinavium]
MDKHEVMTNTKNSLKYPVKYNSDFIPIFSRQEHGILTWRIDLEKFIVTGVDLHVETILGYTSDELIGMKLNRILTKASRDLVNEYLPCWLDRLKKDPDKGFFVSGFLEYLCKNGDSIWLEVTAYLALNDHECFEVNCISRKVKRRLGATSFFLNDKFEEHYLLKTIWNQVPGILTCLDRDGKYILVNDNFTQVMAKSREEIIGSSFIQLLPKKLLKKHQGYFKECLKGKTVSFIDRLENMEGEPRWFYGLYTPICLHEAFAEKIIILATELTKGYKLTKQLMAAEKVFNIGSWQYEFPTKKFFCSEELLELFELMEDDVKKDSFHALLKYLDEEEVLKVKERLIKPLLKEQQCEASITVTLPSGRRRVLKITLLLVKNACGEPQKIFGCVEDVSSETRLLNECSESELRVREFLHAVPGAGVLLSVTGIVIEVFDYNECLTDLDAHKWQGQSFFTFYPLAEAQKLLAKVTYAVKENVLQFYDLHLNLDGNEYFFHMRIVPLHYKWKSRATVACYITRQDGMKEVLNPIHEKKWRRYLLNQLIENKIELSEATLDQLWSVGLDLTRNFSCYVVTFTPQDAADGVLVIKDQTEDVLKRQENLENSIVWQTKEGIAILQPVVKTDKPYKNKEQLQALTWQKNLEKQLKGFKFSIGIAEYKDNTFCHLPKMYEQALTAVKLGDKLFQDRSVFHYLDIGVFQFFNEVADNNSIKDFIKRNIGQLILYDQNHNTDFLQTLRVLVRNGNVSEAAKELFVHRQTVIFRKKRIESILETSLDDFESRLAIVMALKFRQAMETSVF